MLILQRKAGEALMIGENVEVRVISVDGTRVRLAISAPEEAAPAELLGLLGGVLDRREGPAGDAPETQTPAAPEGKED